MNERFAVYVFSSIAVCVIHFHMFIIVGNVKGHHHYNLCGA